MPHLSRYQLSNDQVQALADRIAAAAFLINSREGIRMFFQDLLTRTEKAMLGKRIMIAMMLEEGSPYKDIRRILKVSDGTVAVIHERLQRDGRGLRIGLEQIRKREKFNTVIEKFLKIFDAVPKSKLVFSRRKGAYSDTSKY